jgi:hypothetical protein
MYRTRLIALASAAALSAGAIAACNPFASKHHVAQIEPGDVAAANSWNGSLSTPTGMAGAVDIKGSATLAPGASPKTSIATVSISNAPPGGDHPWHLHQGRCGDNGEIVGPASAYPMLSVGSDGHASAKATLPITTPTSGNYYVSVEASPTTPQTILACGNLAPPSSK